MLSVRSLVGCAMRLSRTVFTSTQMIACPQRTPVWKARECRWNLPAASRGLHTAGDKDLVDFLKDEIKIEKQNQKSSAKSSKIKGFEIVKCDGPNVTLKKILENETITVKFNVNNSIEDASFEDPDAPKQDGQEPAETKMVCKPAFIIEISKGGNKTLAVQCAFPPSDEYPTEHDPQEPYEDLIEIQDIALLDKNQEWTDDVYNLSSSVMDGNLYDMLMKLLEERGIDADFVDQLTEFGTTYEHSKYVDALEQLKDFVASK